MRKLFLVVPCLNEADVLPLSLPRMLSALDSLGGTVPEGEMETGILIADDGSTDGTADFLKTFPDPRVQHLPLPHSGQQGAILGGIRAALEQGADAVITLDADLQDDPEAIPQMVEKWLGGKQVIYGIRNDRGRDSAFKKTSAWLFYALMHLSDRRHIPGHADFRLMDRRCLEALLEKATPSGDLIRNLVPTLGFDADTVFYTRGDRPAGESKYNLFRMMGLSWKGLLAQAPVCLFFLILLTFTAFFLTSIDSPLHDDMVAHGGYIRHDSAWYFMGGKSWVNGLVPYVDFADSKGPLLWLFYALAYLISPRSWIGVFWINALAYVATAALLFHLSLLLTSSPKKSLRIGVLLNFFYFIPLLIFDDKAEALTLPFVALSLLMAGKSLWGKGGSFFLWGLAFGAILLIKFSVAAMTGIFLIAMLLRLRGWKSFLKAAGGALGGFALIVVPVLALLWREGALEAFFQEYFLKTFLTINNILDANDPGEFLRYEMLGYMAVAVAGTLSAAVALKKAKWFPPVALAWFLLCLARYARTYYFIPVGTLMVFTVLALLRCFERDFGWKRYVFGTLIAGALVFFGISNGWTYKEDYFYGREMNLHRERAQAYIHLVAEKRHPRVLYWGCGDHGYGIRAEDLPACKYWALQAGSTPEMDENQENTVKNQLADFIFINTYDWEREHKLSEYGYIRCPKPEFGPYGVFIRKE